MSVVSRVGLVSVVVAAYDVADYLPATLDSVLDQDGVDLEVVVVDDGSTDGTGAIADAYAERDGRVTVVHQPNGGLGAARNAGIAVAAGEFLTFCDADDVLPAGALRVLVESLRGSGSDVAVGRIHRWLPDGSHAEPVWVTESHAAAPLLGVMVDEHPLVVKDVIACNRLHRRSAWDARVGTFAVGIAYEDHVPTLLAYLSGARIDVLDEVTYLWRTRPDQSSISQRKDEATNLSDRLAVMAEAWDAVRDASPAVRSMWLARALELDLAGYYRHAAVLPELRGPLHEAASRYLELADDDALRYVSVHRKVSAWLAAEQRWDALAWLEERENLLTLRRRARLVDGWPTARASRLASRFGLDVPARVLALSHFDTSARASLVELRHGPTAIDVELDVWLRGVKQPTGLDEVRLELRLIDVGAGGRDAGGRRAEDEGASDHAFRVVAALAEGRRVRASIDAAALRTWARGRTDTVTVTARYAWGEASGATSVRVPSDRLPPAQPSQPPGVRGETADDGALRLRLG